MSKKRRARREVKIGLPPGSAVYVGQPREAGVHLRAFAYDTQGLQEHTHPEPEEVRALVAPGRVVWLDCDGVHDVALVKEVCERFGVHHLAMEDVLNTEGRPKLDQFEGGVLLFAVHMLTCEDGEVATEHVSFLLGTGFLLSFQEGRAGDLFDPVRQRIRAGTGRIRTLGPDYLLHALVDTVVDGYFGVVSRLEEAIDRAEADALDPAAPGIPQRVYALKSDLGRIRGSVLPLREAIGRLQRGEAEQVGRGVDPYLRDLYDHVMQVLDMVETDRERLSGVIELHLAIQTHRMNDVMKLLTIITSIFIPLSWIAGVYGMNFEHMPELGWRYGYFATLGLMGVVAIGMVGWFRYRDWL